MHAHLPRIATKVLTLAALLALSACSSTPKDEFAGISDEQLYSDAKQDAKEGNYERAIKQFEKLEARAAGTPVATQSQLDLSHAYYKSNERAQALAAIERFIKLHPGSAAIDYAYYLKGLINFNDDLGLFSSLSNVDLSERDQQASKDAYQAFAHVVSQFPQSKYAEDAQLRMRYIVNSLAAYEVHVARYYYRRGAYLAAINRTQQALQEFPTAPATEEALFLMASSYERLNMTDLRDDTQRVLQHNFPQSAYVRDGHLEPQKKRWWHLW